jgi:transcriptional regulator with XRE-family HTH domain
MDTIRIKQLCASRNWTQARLAAECGIDPPALSRMLAGKKRFQVTDVEKIAAALDVDMAELIGGRRASAAPLVPTGFSDDLVPYEAGPADPFRGLLTETRYLFKVQCESLSAVGIFRDYLVVVDSGAAAVKALAPLGLVHAQYHPDPETFDRAVSLLRQWVPPSLLITNSMTHNEVPIDTVRQDAQIMGVIVSYHRALLG